MGLHFAEVAVIANVIADAVFVEVGEFLGLAGKLFSDLECFEDGAGVGFAAAEVVHFGHPGNLNKLPHETNNIFTMNIITTYLPL